MLGPMTAVKFSVSMEAELGTALREAADRSGEGLSQWVAQAVAARLRSEALAEYLDDYEAKHGAFTAEELAKAARELGLPVPSADAPAA